MTINIPNSAGVYEIRWARNGEPQPISRANGIDESGRLYIGKSYDLKQRIRRFRRGILRSIEGRENSNIHTAAFTYAVYQYGKKFRSEQLELRYASLSKQEADRFEKDLLAKYVSTYLDKPPLNISVARMR